MTERARLIAESRDGRMVDMNVAAGTSLLQACDEHGAPIPFCCRSASCGTCRVQLLEGAEHLLPPAEDELDVLDMYGELSSQVRLACQARLRPGGATVHFRALEEA
jgi:ferredoxin